MVERVEDELGPLSIVVNNAGITRDNVVDDDGADDFDAVVPRICAARSSSRKAAARRMFRRRQGCIVNISSVVGRRGNAGQANYAAAKAGIIGLTMSLAKELGGRGVRVNAVAPGYVDTPMTQALPRADEEGHHRGHAAARHGHHPRTSPTRSCYLASPRRVSSPAHAPVDGGLGI